MNIYLLSQNVNSGYDTYDSMVVAAKNEEDARTIYPSPYVTHTSSEGWMGTYSRGQNVGKEYSVDGYDWVNYRDIYKINVELIGSTDKERGVILASFNAG